MSETYKEKINRQNLYVISIIFSLITLFLISGVNAIDFSVNETSGFTPLSIQFTVINDNESFNPVSYYWDFGDGYSTTEANPIYTYETSGNMTVFLSGINELSEEENTTKTDYISVYEVSPIYLICGNIPLTLTDKGTDYLRWSWLEDSTISGASLDGIYLPTFDVMSNTYIATELSANSTHVFKIYNTTDSGCNSSKTNELPPTESFKIMSVINAYMLFLLALICIIIGIFVPPVGFGAVLFALVGLTTSVNNSATLLFLYLLCIIVGIVEGLTTEW